MVQKFQIKSGTVEAVQYSGENLTEILNFTKSINNQNNVGKHDWILLTVKDRNHTAYIGHWVTISENGKIKVYSEVEFSEIFEVGSKNDFCKERDVLGLEVCSEQCEECKKVPQ